MAHCCVAEHCTHYYVTFHLTYRCFFFLVHLFPQGRGSQIQLNTRCDQNSSLSRNRRKIRRTSYSHFHDFPGARPDSRTFQAWRIWLLNYRSFWDLYELLISAGIVCNVDKCRKLLPTATAWLRLALTFDHLYHTIHVAGGKSRRVQCRVLGCANV